MKLDSIGDGQRHQASAATIIALSIAECNIRSDDSVSIHRLSQSYVSSNNLVKVFLRFSPRFDWDQGFLNRQVMS